MPVLGMNIESIEAKRSSGIKGKLNINTSPSIKDIKEVDVPSMGKKALDIRFEYTCSYTSQMDKKEKEVAVILMAGKVLFMAEDNEKIMKSWKDKKVDADLAVPVMNTILRKCITKSMTLAEDLQLPSPLKIPVVKSAKDSPRYIG